MIILIDSQEQARWRFPGDTLVKKLATGDYSIQGYTDLITIERKSLNDLVKTVINDWLRFSRELRRMASMDYAAIVVEAPVTAVANGAYESNANPNSVRGKLNAIYLDFGVPTLFLDNREIAQDWVYNLFDLYTQRKG